MAESTAVPAGTTPTLTDEAIDDILYLSRMGDLDELRPLIQSLSSGADAAAILAAAIDPASGNSALHMAAANGHGETLQWLLQTLGYAPSSGGGGVLNHRNGAGNTALHWAAVNGQLRSVQLLVAVGADPDVANGRGHRAVFEADAAGHDDVVACLLSIGQDEEDAAEAAAKEAAAKDATTAKEGGEMEEATEGEGEGEKKATGGAEKK